MLTGVQYDVRRNGGFVLNGWLFTTSRKKTTLITPGADIFDVIRCELIMSKALTVPTRGGAGRDNRGGIYRCWKNRTFQRLTVRC